MPTCDELRTRGTVAVVGAGPAGLTLTRLLQTRGFSVRIFERDSASTARLQGGSLDLRPASGQRAIRDAGLGEAFDRFSRTEAEAFTMLSRHGEVQTVDQPLDQEDNGPEIDRADLRRLLLDAVGPDTIAWDHALGDAVPEPDGRWRLEFRNQPPVTADLVIGADGMHSRIRRRLTPVEPRYFGIAMLAAIVRRDLWRGSKLDALLGEGSMLVAGSGQTIWVQRCNHDVIRFYFSMNVDPDWPTSEGIALTDTAAVLDAVTAAYHDWSPEVLAMFTQIEDGLERWPLHVLPPDIRWTTQPGATILGDAAHIMPPFTGKGVNLALLDALELADGLTASPAADVTAVLETFEKGMQDRTRTEIGLCLKVGREIYQTEIDFTRP
jgi:2-polyprenyl-6-methoxyphenol hydroxylase-like FAD-dependent oxidoreductase